MARSERTSPVLHILPTSQLLRNYRGSSLVFWLARRLSQFSSMASQTDAFLFHQSPKSGSSAPRARAQPWDRATGNAPPPPKWPTSAVSSWPPSSEVTWRRGSSLSPSPSGSSGRSRQDAREAGKLHGRRLRESLGVDQRRRCSSRANARRSSSEPQQVRRRGATQFGFHPERLEHTGGQVLGGMESPPVDRCVPRASRSNIRSRRAAALAVQPAHLARTAGPMHARADAGPSSPRARAVVEIDQPSTAATRAASVVTSFVTDAQRTSSSRARRVAMTSPSRTYRSRERRGPALDLPKCFLHRRAILVAWLAGSFFRLALRGDDRLLARGARRPSHPRARLRRDGGRRRSPR